MRGSTVKHIFEIIRRSLNVAGGFDGEWREKAVCIKRGQAST